MAEKQISPIVLFIGLGNPGDKYCHNRHNIGFMAIDEIARAHNFPDFREKFQGLVSEKIIGDTKIYLFKPLTFMNNSGEAVRKITDFYKILPEQLIVFHDELDLPAGKVRTKIGGGAAGHNGLRSIDAHIGKNYQRLRMGIGHPGDKNMVHSYVLNDFAKSEHSWLTRLLEACAKYWPECIRGKIDSYTSKIAMEMAEFLNDKKQTEKQTDNGDKRNGV